MMLSIVIRHEFPSRPFKDAEIRDYRLLAQIILKSFEFIASAK